MHGIVLLVYQQYCMSSLIFCERNFCFNFLMALYVVCVYLHLSRTGRWWPGLSIEWGWSACVQSGGVEATRRAAMLSEHVSLWRAPGLVWSCMPVQYVPMHDRYSVAFVLAGASLFRYRSMHLFSLRHFLYTYGVHAWHVTLGMIQSVLE